MLPLMPSTKFVGIGRTCSSDQWLHVKINVQRPSLRLVPNQERLGHIRTDIDFTS